MKIIHQGKIPPSLERWYLNEHHRCTSCNSLLELEPLDEVEAWESIELKGKAVTFRCIYCGEQVISKEN